MSERPAGAAHGVTPVAGDTLGNALDPAEPFPIEVDELARRLALVAPRRRARLQVVEPGETEPLAALGDRSDGDAKLDDGDR